MEAPDTNFVELTTTSSDLEANVSPPLTVQSAYNAKHRLRKLKISAYDLTNRCNLRCEGCLFYSGDDYLRHEDANDVEGWDSFFKQEAARGVNFVYLAGAEPALEPDRIRAAHRHIKNGVVFSNGTIRLPDDIGYRFHISLWGGSQSTKKLRGADTNAKAFRNFGNDPRAVFVLTLNPHNLDEAEDVTRLCADHGAKLAFSLFSPTTSYIERLREANPKRDKFFRFSDAESNLLFSPDTLRSARDIIFDLTDRYPDTVIAAKGYYDWLCTSKSLYDLDANGVATNCGNRLSSDWRNFGTDRKQMPDRKCCSPNIDCSECRAYAMSLGTYVNVRPERHTPGALARWQEATKMWAELFFNDHPATKISTSSTRNPRNNT